MRTVFHWVLVNAPLVLVFAALSPLLALAGPVSPLAATVLGGLVAFPIAGLILLDFARRSDAGEVLDDSGRLLLAPALAGATRHTFWHAAWPHALNVSYSLGYTCLFFAFGRSHPHVMGVWLSVVLLLTVLRDGKLRRRLLGWRALSGIVALGAGLLLLTSVQTGGSELHADLGPWQLVGANVILVAAGYFVWLLLRGRTLRSAWAWPVGMGCYLCASLILRDFSMHAGQLTVSADGVDLSAAYDRALYHTLAYCAWPHALNVFFALGFATLYAQTKSASTAMAGWLVATVAIPLAFHAVEFLSSWQSPVALALMAYAGYQLWAVTRPTPDVTS